MAGEFEAYVVKDTQSSTKNISVTSVRFMERKLTSGKRKIINYYIEMKMFLLLIFQVEEKLKNANELTQV